ncbi:hypothetical protein [Streptomyces indicus]|uniref:protein-tyrosine-phosphatase n=1 Tax=Streptomyces indicus TaxID=417292 RepID=A0A1G9CH49_9ACTN|nr:hypothetical protein [Streptomyces indicus]SDK50993.1 protein-tyrosine phosphatase [Streptomyces indicus]
MRVLFVCTGNVHRSVLAECLLARRAPELTVSSAGTEARHVTGMDAATRSVLIRFGGSAEGFASRPLTADLVAGADLVLGMEREHREAAVRLEPVAMRRCFTLKEFLRLARGLQGDPPAPPEIVARVAAERGRVLAPPARADGFEDPWAKGYDVLLACAAELDEAVEQLCGVLGAGYARGAVRDISAQ